MNSPEENQAELADSGVPDLLRPAQPLINPLDLVSRALRGFCSPHDSNQQILQKRNQYSEIASSSHCLSTHQPGTVDKKQQFVDTFHNDACNSTITTMSDDWDDRDSTKELDAPHQCEDGEASDDEAEDVVVVETVPGTHRIVRVMRALEIFLCTIALLVATVAAAQRFGVQLEWYTKLDVADASFVSVMKQNNVVEATFEIQVEAEVCTKDDVTVTTEMLAQDIGGDEDHGVGESDVASQTHHTFREV